jgi:hypothetical protein
VPLDTCHGVTHTNTHTHGAFHYLLIDCSIEQWSRLMVLICHSQSVSASLDVIYVMSMNIDVAGYDCVWRVYCMKRG